MNNDVILIGPIGAGKSTIGKLLAEKLNVPQIAMDDVRFDYYKEIGYDEEVVKSKWETDGFWAVYQYWKPFEAYAVERLLSEHRNSVIDFVAGHSVYEDEGLFARVQKVLSGCKNVILLLPSPDLDESIEILNERNEFLREMKPNINEHFIRHHSNSDLANYTVYTKDKTPRRPVERSCA